MGEREQTMNGTKKQIKGSRLKSTHIDNRVTCHWSNIYQRKDCDLSHMEAFTNWKLPRPDSLGVREDSLINVAD